MSLYQIERLKINYKTLEEFQKFQQVWSRKTVMLEDLQANIIENNSDSPFYGIYSEGSLDNELLVPDRSEV